MRALLFKTFGRPAGKIVTQAKTALVRLRVAPTFVAVFLCLGRNLTAVADQGSAATEVYTAEGLPGQEGITPSHLHGLYRACFDKRVSDSRVTKPFPVVLTACDDILHWSIAGGGVWFVGESTASNSARA